MDRDELHRRIQQLIFKPVTPETTAEAVELQRMLFFHMRVSALRDYTLLDKIIFWVRGRFEEDAT